MNFIYTVYYNLGMVDDILKKLGVIDFINPHERVQTIHNWGKVESFKMYIPSSTRVWLIVDEINGEDKTNELKIGQPEDIPGKKIISFSENVSDGYGVSLGNLDRFPERVKRILQLLGSEEVYDYNKLHISCSVNVRVYL